MYLEGQRFPRETSSLHDLKRSPSSSPLTDTVGLIRPPLDFRFPLGNTGCHRVTSDSRSSFSLRSRRQGEARLKDIIASAKNIEWNVRSTGTCTCTCHSLGTETFLRSRMSQLVPVNPNSHDEPLVISSAKDTLI